MRSPPSPAPVPFPTRASRRGTTAEIEDHALLDFFIRAPLLYICCRHDSSGITARGLRGDKTSFLRCYSVSCRPECVLASHLCRKMWKATMGYHVLGIHTRISLNTQIAGFRGATAAGVGWCHTEAEHSQKRTCTLQQTGARIPSHPSRAACILESLRTFPPFCTGKPHPKSA